MNQQEGYLPKEQRKNVLLICDDIRFSTGVGFMGRTIVLGSAHRFNWTIIGGGVNHPDAGKRLDMTADTNNILKITDSSVVMFPFNGYGNIEFIREIVKHEKIEAIFFITDPRYYDWLFRAEHELRTGGPGRNPVKLIYLNIWDDEPAPLYNTPAYRSCDGLLCISRQTESLVKIALGKYADSKYIRYVPHGVNPNQFYPINSNHPQYPDLLKFRNDILKGKEYDFVLGFNSRNIRRKSIPDTLLAFKTFLDMLEPSQAARCAFVLHTQPVDENGTDLYAVREMLFGDRQDQIIFSDLRAPVEYMNFLYNMFDSTILLSSNEGFGLSILESIMSGTPVIGNVTGGIQDQARFEDHNGRWITFNEKFSSNHLGRYRKCGEWFLPVFPSNVSIQGSVPTPYITDDRASFSEAAVKIYEVYSMSLEQRESKGQSGRDWVMSEESMMSEEAMCKNVVESIEDILSDTSVRERYTVRKIEPRPLKYLSHPISY